MSPRNRENKAKPSANLPSYELGHYLLTVTEKASIETKNRSGLRNSPNNTMDSDDEARELAQIRLDDAKEISFANTAVP